MADLIELDTCVVDLARRVVVRDGDNGSLTRNEAALLAAHVERAGDVVPREDLLGVLGYRTGAHTGALDTAMRRLRKKVEADPKNPMFIKTVYGIGYRYDPPATTTIWTA